MRLIDADKLEKQLDNEKWMDNYDRDFIVDVALDEAPTVDAVPVVRCKDCAHGRYDEDSEMYDCGYVGLAIYTEPNHYCSYGERKEN
jgi:hypothetical protein